MMGISFRKDAKDSIFSYTYVSGHMCDNEEECKREFENSFLKQKSGERFPSEETFKQLLSFSSHILDGLEIFALKRSFPELDKNLPLKEFRLSNWEYKVVTNDFEGLGVDKGFCQVIGDLSLGAFKNKRPSVVFPVLSVNDIINLPEEAFEEKFYNVSLFGLKKNRKEDLMFLLSNLSKPDLSYFLLEGERFINVVCGKEYGYFDSLLVKSVDDIEEALKEENVEIKK